jgi:DNA-binding NtrC family response regulator
MEAQCLLDKLAGIRQGNSMEKACILIIEDDDLQYEIYEDALGSYRLVRAQTGSEALTLLGQSPPDLIILDHILAEGELGLDYLPELNEVLPHVPIIIVSGALEVHQQMQALQGPRRAHYCITKPVDVHELRRTVETALKECGQTEVIRRFEALERSRRIDIAELLSRSTDRLSRQNQILDLVKQTAGRPNVSALARRFRVARRTIIRDLQELIRRGQLPPGAFPKWEEPES